MRKIYLITTLLLTVILSMFIQQEAIAVVIDPKPIEYKQPNGIIVKIISQGNEYRFYDETLDGYTWHKGKIVENILHPQN